MIFSRRVFGFLRNSRAIYLTEFIREIFQLREKDIGGHLPSFLVIVCIKHNTTEFVERRMTKPFAQYRLAVFWITTV